jgi:hypothetical protein
MLSVQMPVADLLVKQLMPERFRRLETIAYFPVNLHLVFGVPLEVLTEEKEKGFKKCNISVEFFLMPNFYFQQLVYFLCPAKAALY